MTDSYRAPEAAHRYVLDLVRGADRDRFLAMILDDAARLDRLVSRLLELALERPRTRELVALDELTPHVREVRVQFR